MSDDDEITAILAAALPKGEHNGLAPYARLLADFPRKVRVAMILLDCSKSTVRHVDDSQVATARIRRIELITDPGDAKVMERILLRAFETRTGQVTLPFELEEDVKAAFDDFDATVDEVRMDTLLAQEVVAELDEKKSKPIEIPTVEVVSEDPPPPKRKPRSRKKDPSQGAETIDPETVKIPNDASELFSNPSEVDNEEENDPTAGPWGDE